MSWEQFIYFAMAAILLWAIGAWAAWKGKTGFAYTATIVGLPLAGFIVYSRWKYKWILTFSTILALVFISVNLFKPEIHDKTLMPALQSPWFAPHVIVADEESDITDNLVYVGLAFLTIGMLFGALWAKEAWGHYWSWDPKETWAAITWLAYLVYVHYRNLPHHRERLALWILIVSFVLLQMCWWGINYLPSAQGSSVHTYSMSE